MVLCDNLEVGGWDAGVKEIQEGGDMCILMSDSRCAWRKPIHYKAIIFQLKPNLKNHK